MGRSAVEGLIWTAFEATLTVLGRPDRATELKSVFMTVKLEGQRMRTLLMVMLGAGLTCPLLAQEDPLSTEARQAWNRTNNLVVAAANKMPEEHYSYKPAPESQSFGDLVAHTANAALGVCSGYMGERKRAGVNGSSSKADLLAALEAAAAECDGAYNSLTDARASEMIEGRRRSRSRLGTLYGNTIHIEHEYAQMAVHMRANGLVPPSSEGR